MKCPVIERDGGTITPMLGGLVFIVLTMVALATEVAGLHSAFLEVAAVADAAAELVVIFSGMIISSYPK